MGHLSKAQRLIKMDEVLEIVRKHPEMPMTLLSESIGMGRNRVNEWYRYDVDGFKARYEEALRDAFNRLEGLAIKTMGDLLVDGSFQAAKYILDNRNYGAAQKVKADISGDMDINIVIGDE